MTRRRRRRRRRRTVVVFLWGAAFYLVYVDAEDEQPGYLDVQPFCNRRIVEATAVYLTCDSPGAYYYGSGAYRKSEVCMSGDRVNLEVDCTSSKKKKKSWQTHSVLFPENLRILHHFSILCYCYLSVTISDEFRSETIMIQIDFGLYNLFSTALSSTDLCQLSGLKSTSGSSCPYAGTYKLYTYQTLPQTRDYSFHYTPDVKITLTDENGRLLGCATTGTVAINTTANNRAQQGLIALGISVLAFILIFGALLYLSYRRKKRLEKVAERSKTLRYHYFRTLPNGQVIPIPAGAQQQQHHHHHLPQYDGTTSSSQQSESSSYDDSATSGEGTFHNSLPSYNEPQIPTRPMI